MNDRYLDEAVAVTVSGKRAPILTHTCRSFLERFCGLMLKREVPEACGLYFPNCRSIHTCMMRVPIDVVWVREGKPGELEAVSLDTTLKPWRFFAAPRGATGCVEFRAGSFDAADRPTKIARPEATLPYPAARRSIRPPHFSISGRGCKVFAGRAHLLDDCGVYLLPYLKDLRKAGAPMKPTIDPAGGRSAHMHGMGAV